MVAFFNPTKGLPHAPQVRTLLENHAHLIGGWYYLPTALDDFSRYIIAWLLCNAMAADDVKRTLELAVTQTGVTGAEMRHRPRLLSDNVSCYLAGELKEYLDQYGINHTRGKPYSL